MNDNSSVKRRGRCTPDRRGATTWAFFEAYVSVEPAVAWLRSGVRSEGTASRGHAPRERGRSHFSPVRFTLLAGGVFWFQEAKLKTTGTRAFDSFGSSLAISEWRPGRRRDGRGQRRGRSGRSPERGALGQWGGVPISDKPGARGADALAMFIEVVPGSFLAAGDHDGRPASHLRRRIGERLRGGPACRSSSGAVRGGSPPRREGARGRGEAVIDEATALVTHVRGSAPPPSARSPSVSGRAARSCAVPHDDGRGPIRRSASRRRSRADPVSAPSDADVVPTFAAASRPRAGSRSI